MDGLLSLCYCGAGCCGCGWSGWSAGAGAPGTGGIGVGCCTGLGCDSSSLFFLSASRVLSPVAVDVFFFFFPEVSPDNPNGADCVCWSATSPASGGDRPSRARWATVGIRLGRFRSLGARAEARLLGWCGGLQRIGWLIRI